MSCLRFCNFLVFLASVVVISTALSRIYAAEPLDGEKKSKRGWNWYEELPRPEPIHLDRAVKPDIPPLYVLKQMTPEAVGEIMEAQLAYAIASEEVAEVAAYYTLMDFVRRRSRTFTALTSIALLENPSLNARTDYPVTNAGRTAKSRARKEERDRRLVESNRDYALIMFSSEGCGYCDVQWATVQAFKDKAGWVIRRLDVAAYPERAARFAVEATPTTILIRKGSDTWFPVAVGVESLPVLSDNIYRAIRLIAGETHPRQFLNSESDDGGFFDPGKFLRLSAGDPYPDERRDE